MAKQSDSQQKDKTNSDLTEKVLHINRCSKVVKGGRKFSFSALILVGDGKGRVGYGFAKANELTDAIRKGGEIARKSMIRIENDGSTIPHEILEKWDGAVLLLKPAPDGSGVIAGSKVRAVFELAGIKNVMAKNMGSNNPINQIKVAFKAILKLCNRNKIKQARTAGAIE
ncbi:MAG: 30S ribosomal protein S5 [Parachlamydiaceae bacterium]|nr:30S ribosomal protein S5 [Parachlamydiaceae bacterium]